MASDTTIKENRSLQPLAMAGLAIGALILAAVILWQAVTAGGTPDPTVPHTSTPVAILDIAVLVFREGLEAVLVLSAITAGLMGSNQPYRRPIAIGTGVGFIVTLITWFIVVGIINDLTQSIPALDVQAGTGLLAIIVLLIVMNWFFHKVYWTGWISVHNRRKRDLMQEARDPGSSRTRLLLGLVLLGATSFYREGFEVVLFLQSYRLQMGGWVVLYGAILGLIFTGIVAVLNFVGHHRLPYKKMLIVTGVMLAFVLFVMVGEQVFEMQQANWIGATTISWLQWVPGWAGTWFSIFPNWETVIAQIIVVVLVLGSYVVARYEAVSLPKKRGMAPFQPLEAPPAEDAATLASSSVITQKS
jgi:high-affinity iron transporter